MVEAALEGAAGDSALDLYAGVGLFALPLAQRFREVTAVESSFAAVRDMEFSAERAGLAVKACHDAVETYLDKLTAPPDFVLADPPRAGIGRHVARRLAELAPPRITLVSCDPATLARDLADPAGRRLPYRAADDGRPVPPDLPPGDGGAAGERLSCGRVPSLPSAPNLVNWSLASPKAKAMKFGVIVFPGSNCDHDAWYAVGHNLGQPVEFIWHDSEDLGAVDAVILPGGFSYGDYLRCGAIAKFSPVMKAVSRFASEGGLVLGICNGFQILVEAGLLPGALIRNRGLKFICREVGLRVETTDSPFTNAAQKGQVLRVPIAHGEGCYVADERTLDELEAEDRVAFRYVDNPNGSLRDIAGILNPGRNVLGMMPHPERAADPLMGSTDGLAVLRSLQAAGVLKP